MDAVELRGSDVVSVHVPFFPSGSRIGGFFVVLVYCAEVWKNWRVFKVQ